jgi:hypothetical protein
MLRRLAGPDIPISTSFGKSSKKRHLFGFVDAMDVSEFNDFALYGLELRLIRTGCHETGILKKNG